MWSPEDTEGPLGFYDKEGARISWETYMDYKEDLPYRIIGRTVLSDGRTVSTVWVGQDLGAYGDKPLIFESLIFKDCSLSEPVSDATFYSTLEEAREGHQEIVQSTEGSG